MDKIINRLIKKFVIMNNLDICELFSEFNVHRNLIKSLLKKLGKKRYLPHLLITQDLTENNLNI
jgi:hypothetical protein